MNDAPKIIRDARLSDAQAIVDIYRPIVTETAISFEIDCPEVPEMMERLQRVQRHWPWLVMEGEDRLRGYAYTRPFRERRAYQHTVETTVYVHSNDRGQGVGRALMEVLLLRLQEAGHHAVIAAITLPNPASVALHEGLGFRQIGVFPEVGRKFFAWHDVGFWWLDLDGAY
jgi:phosphinothricin acetyltransferase